MSHNKTSTILGARHKCKKLDQTESAHYMIHQTPESQQIYHQHQTNSAPDSKQHNVKASSVGKPQLESPPAVQLNLSLDFEPPSGQYNAQYQDKLNKIRERLFRLLSKVPIQVGSDSSPVAVSSSSSSSSTSSSSSSSSSATLFEQTHGRASTSSSSLESSVHNQRVSDREPLVIKYYNERSLSDIINLHFACSLTKHNFERGLNIKQPSDVVTQSSNELTRSMVDSTPVCYNSSVIGYPQDYQADQQILWTPVAYENATTAAATTSNSQLLSQSGQGWQSSNAILSWTPSAAECHFTASSGEQYFHHNRPDGKLMNNNHDVNPITLKLTKDSSELQTSKQQYNTVAVGSLLAKRTRRCLNGVSLRTEIAREPPYDKDGRHSRGCQGKMDPQTNTFLFEPSNGYSLREGSMLTEPAHRQSGQQYTDQFDQTYPMQGENAMSFIHIDPKQMDTTCLPFQHPASSGELPLQAAYSGHPAEQSTSYQQSDHFESHYYQHPPLNASFQQQAMDSSGNWLSQPDEMSQQLQLQQQQPQMIEQLAGDGPISETPNGYSELVRDRGFCLATPSYFVYAAERQPLELAPANQSAS